MRHVRRGSTTLTLAVAAGVLIASLATTGAARAQPAAPPPAGGAVAASVAAMMAKLNLTPQQQAAMLAYYALRNDPAFQPHPDVDAYWAMSLPQQLDFAADQATADAAMLRQRAAAAWRFYEMLTPDQRKAFAASDSPPTGHSPQATLADMTRKLPSHTDPDWRDKPTAEDIWRVYPRIARRNKIAGQAMLHCLVDVSGFLSDCTVTDETPAGMGFANAALEISGFLRMNPATTFGMPGESGVNVPITFYPRRLSAPTASPPPPPPR